MISVVKIKTKTDLQTAFAIRNQVFVIEQAVDASEEYDDDDEKCTHFLASYKNIACGTARWRFKDKGIIKLERFAVLSEYRNHKVGAALVHAVLNDLPYAEKIMMHAQLHAIPFYEKMGFESYGPQFEEAGIQHFAMSWMGEINDY
jgi:predicted GNAT family N-acyltransferase